MLLRAAVAVLLALLVVSCGGGSPSQPSPQPQPQPQPQPNNEAPRITGLNVSAERTEVETDVTLTATVEDAETPAAQLRYEWSAPVGTFSGEGATVRWRAPKGATTPADVTIKLTVRESYGTAGAGGVRPEHVVMRDVPPIRLHDSVKEVGDLSMAFLRDFANSSIAPRDAVRDFTDSCPGKRAELEDVEKNRTVYVITGSELNLRSVRITQPFSGAEAKVACAFTSRVVQCHPEIPDCTVGMTTEFAATCALTARYEQQRWWLCDSYIEPGLRSVPRFFFGH